MKYLLLGFFLLTNIYTLIAQPAKKNKKDSATSNFKADFSYLSNSVYNGRKDSVITPYITPSIGYYDKSGFYISGSFSYLANPSESRIDLYSFDAGYDFSFSDKFIGSVYANKSFYNKTSTAIKSAITGSVGASLSYDFDILQVNAGTDILFSQKSDITLNLGLEHAFYIGDDDHLFTIAPAISTNMSSLNFYAGYTNRKVGKKAQQIIPNLLSSSSTTTVDNNKFTLMDYEMSVPFTYDSKTFGLFLTPIFAIPQNPIYTTTTTVNKLRNGTQTSQTINSTPQSEKKLENTFYVELGFYLKF